MNIQEYINQLREEINNVEDIVKASLKRNEGKILSLIKLRLYQRGIDGDGNKIMPTYSLSTIEDKKAIGQITSHVTLRNTGLFYKSFYVTYYKDEISVNSNLDKAQFLTEKYGESILDLTNQEIEIIVLSIIEPDIIKRINNFSQIKLDL